jgi:hypothetical protein
MKVVIQWVRTLTVVFGLIILGELLPPLRELDRWMAERQLGWLIGAGGLAFLGLVLMLDGMLDLLMAQGEPLSPEGAEAPAGSRRWPRATWRATRYRLPRRTSGTEGSEEFSFRALKDACRTGLVWRDARWLRRLITGVGALLMMVGVFGIPFVLGAPGIKLLTGGAVLYALTRFAWGMWRA